MLRFHLFVKRSLILFFKFSISNFTYGKPLHNCLQSKSNNRKSMHSTLTYSLIFVLSGAKISLFCEINKYFAGKMAFSLTFFHLDVIRWAFRSMILGVATSNLVSEASWTCRLAGIGSQAAASATSSGSSA